MIQRASSTSKLAQEGCGGPKAPGLTNDDLEQSEETSSQSSSAGDYTCPICQDLLSDPVVGKCGHAFCQHCLHKWEEQSKQSRLANFLCPVCRDTLPREQPGVCLLLAKVIEATFPEATAKRKSEFYLEPHSQQPTKLHKLAREEGMTAQAQHASRQRPSLRSGLAYGLQDTCNPAQGTMPGPGTPLSYPSWTASAAAPSSPSRTPVAGAGRRARGSLTSPLNHASNATFPVTRAAPPGDLQTRLPAQPQLPELCLPRQPAYRRQATQHAMLLARPSGALNTILTMHQHFQTLITYMNGLDYEATRDPPAPPQDALERLPAETNVAVDEAVSLPPGHPTRHRHA